MSMKEKLREMVSGLQVVERSLDAIEDRATKKNLFASGHGIDVEIRKGVVIVTCPTGTTVRTECWYNDVTKMSEVWEVGTEDMADYIRLRDDLQSRIDSLEKRL